MNRLMKWNAGILAAATVIGGFVINSGTSNAAPQAVVQTTQGTPIQLNWKGQPTKQQGLLIKDSIYVPITFLRDTLGKNLVYTPKTHTYSIGEGYRTLNLMVSEYGVDVNVNGTYLKDEYNAKMIQGHIYVPYRLLNDYMGLQSNWNPSAKQLSLGARKENSIQIKSVTLQPTLKGATFKVTYPQVSGVSNQAAADKINKDLKEVATLALAQAQKELKTRSPQDREYEYLGDYAITYNEQGVLSVVINQDAYTGGAHGMPSRQAFTFSLKDGSQLNLNDLLKSNKNYKKVLNDQIAKSLKSNGSYLGGFKGLTSDKNFYVQPNTLKIFFQPYEYTAYAEGFVEIGFGFNSLLSKGVNPFK
ncbi:hypothetical protein J2Z69_002481 [Paenibacillus shirakamiensis]|uniref:DUF4163 domain-containing protein n=1 Tax=Paenibacillus shirakamiensis TaxID=1265935 RepID=A0ABS4JK09_9BACL|nr:DUF4163 domain-containing protein [Paenibacillus shirakamiensis]MBP2001436.1 hypothetical protein [Paenibacillus shirakamiensis]